MQSYFVPAWFYSFESFIYLFAAAIGFVISFQLLRLYKITSNKNNLRLYFGLVLLSMGFLTLGVINLYAHLNYQIFYPCSNCIFDEIFGIYDLGYWIYYSSSILAYLIIISAYLPEKQNFPIIMLPVWFLGFKSFHLISFFMLSYVAFRTSYNYFTEKNYYRLMVMLSFLSLTAYHALSFFSVFSEIIYITAHASLIISFLCLMSMVLLVKKK